jgi:hypothetical protein
VARIDNVIKAEAVGVGRIQKLKIIGGEDRHELFTIHGKGSETMVVALAAAINDAIKNAEPRPVVTASASSRSRRPTSSRRPLTSLAWTRGRRATPASNPCVGVGLNGLEPPESAFAQPGYEAVLAAWQAFEERPGSRYLWRSGLGPLGVLIAADGSEAASVHRGRGFDRWVKIGDRRAYDISPRGPLRSTTRVKDAETGELVLTIAGRHHHHDAGMRLTFQNGRVVRFPVYAGSEREVGLSGRRWCLLGVMFAIDASGTQLIARGGTTSPPTLVLCGEATPERLLVAVLGAPLIRQYLAGEAGGA